MAVKSVDDNVEIREVNIYNFTSSGFWDQNCNTNTFSHSLLGMLGGSLTDVVQCFA